MHRIASRLTLALFALLAAALPACAAPWQWANPMPLGDDVSALAGNGTVTVAVAGSAGGGRYLLSSRDGARWHRRALPAGVFISGLAWGGGRFIGVGKAGGVVHSDNGLDWTTAAIIDPSIDLRAAAWGNGRYVAVGMRPVGYHVNGVLVSSADGTDWNEIALPIEGDSSFFDVTFANGRFVVVGSPGVIATSTDGLAWATHTLPYHGDIEGVAGCAGRFVATASDLQTGVPESDASTFVSLDGSTWTLHRAALPPTVLGAIACDDDRFVVVGGMGGPDSYIAHSQDGISWSTRLPDTINAPLAVAWDGARFVTTGEFGFIATSGNGIDWTTRSNAQGQHNLRAVTHAAGQYVAVGIAGTMLQSFDGRTWIPHAHDDADYNAIAYGGAPGASRFVAVGQRFIETLGGYRGAAAHSDDGATWTIAAAPSSASLRALAWGNGRYVAVGDAGTSLVSTDGTSWTSPVEADPTRGFRRLVFGAGVFLALGSDASGERMFMTTDGESWAPASAPPAVADVAWNGGAFVAITRDGHAFASVDGDDWQKLDGPAFGEYARIAWNGREYRAIANSLEPIIGVSTDGVHWRDENAGSIGTPSALASDGLQWVAVGMRGRVLVAGEAIFANDFD